MSLNAETARILKGTTTLGLVIMAIGLLTRSFDFSDTILAVGTVILIFAPVLGIAVSTKCLIQEGDRYWTRIAFILVAIIIIGALLSYFA
ncbi:MAG: hypothetical protein MJZ38_03505 [archaeon]|nr:hypothetical protein [archaeon]